MPVFEKNNTHFTGQDFLNIFKTTIWKKIQKWFDCKIYKGKGEKIGSLKGQFHEMYLNLYQ